MVAILIKLKKEFMKKIFHGALLTAIIITCYSCRLRQKTQIAVNSGPPVYVYTFQTPQGLSTDNARNLITTFLGEKQPEGLVRSAENIVYFSSKDDLNATFEQDLNNGNFTFNKSMKSYLGDYAPRLPIAGGAIKIAEDFMKQNKLFPANSAQLKLVHQGGLRSQSVVDGQRGGPVIDKLITLTYGRVVDSMPVIGPGSKIVVHVGDQGQVMGMIHRWRELAPQRNQVSPGALLTQQEAEGQARKQISSEYGPQSSYTVKVVSKAYYDNNGRILQPVYCFETVVTLGGQDKYVKPFEYLCVISMLKNSPEPLQFVTVDSKARDLIRTSTKGQIDSLGGGKNND
jgi:hypothetical protein